MIPSLDTRTSGINDDKVFNLRADILAAEPFAILLQAALRLLRLLLHLPLALQLGHVAEVGHHTILESKQAWNHTFDIHPEEHLKLFVPTLDGVAGLLEPGGAFEAFRTLLWSDSKLAAVASSLLCSLRCTVANNPETCKVGNKLKDFLFFIVFLNGRLFGSGR